MRCLAKPSCNPKDVYCVCISRVAEKTLKIKLMAIKDLVEQEANNYDKAAHSAAFYTITRRTSVGRVTKEELLKIYSRLSGSRAPGRRIYDKLKLAAKNGQCPLCGQRDVSTLDHYLPKATYPSLAVIPYNLVPACKDCNYNKGETCPTSSDDQTIHPYYDDFIENDRWLYADILHSDPVGAKFFVRAPQNWDREKESRVTYHFNLLKLDELYAALAGEELSGISYMMETIHTTSGAGAVKGQLELMASTYARSSLNSWKGALFEALSNDNWYCDGGFKL